jgi:hypothetical protein
MLDSKVVTYYVPQTDSKMAIEDSHRTFVCAASAYYFKM